jgi:hypothetical protein
VLKIAIAKTGTSSSEPAARKIVRLLLVVRVIKVSAPRNGIKEYMRGQEIDIL